MNTKTFLETWQTHFGNCPPVTHLFKQRLKERWFRFHSLPESKRYASDPIEFAELLHRQNTVLADVIGIDEPCVLVWGFHDCYPDYFSEFPAMQQFKWDKWFDLSSKDPDPNIFEPDEPPFYLHLWISQQPLRPLMLDEVLLLVADWKITNFFVVNAENTRIFAPYDGGVDVILANSNERDQFKAKYQRWLSNYPEGF
jgi:hypothetical protein